MKKAVFAETGGMVQQVLVNVDTKVGAGDTLVVLEAMKMEFPIDAPFSGAVVTIAVKQGDTVQEGDLLLEIVAS
jgi:biotin carboxyl carrier protein